MVLKNNFGSILSAIVFGVAAISLSRLHPFWTLDSRMYDHDFFISKSSNLLPTNTSKHIYWKTHDKKSQDNHVSLQEYDKNGFREVGETYLNLQQKNMYQYIDDHTFKLNTLCKNGTGWIMDFEIPKDKHQYPTTWYIATNMHVINEYRFTSNPYGVELPLTGNIPYRSYDQNQVNQSDPTVKRCLLSINNQSSSFVLSKSVKISNSFDFFFSDLSFDGIMLGDAYQILESTALDPKLIYSGINFLGDRSFEHGGSAKHISYYKDFAVLEITFPSEEEAKNITDNFYYKYHADNNAHAKQPVNMFSPELMSQKSSHSDLLETDNFYMAGYPGNAHREVVFDRNLRYDRKNQQYTKSKLVFGQTHDINHFPLYNSRSQHIAGHISLKDLDRSSDEGKITWNNKKLNNWGYSYALDNAFLLPGSSGSMVIDANKNLLGIYRMHNNRFNHGYIDPIRSDGVLQGRKIILPKFDLITGVEGQEHSYKSQLEKYKPEMNTYLKSINWRQK